MRKPSLETVSATLLGVTTVCSWVLLAMMFNLNAALMGLIGCGATALSVISLTDRPRVKR